MSTLSDLFNIIDQPNADYDNVPVSITHAGYEDTVDLDIIGYTLTYGTDGTLEKFSILVDPDVAE